MATREGGTVKKTPVKDCTNVRTNGLIAIEWTKEMKTALDKEDDWRK